jgi:beta-N-acetylhexosaminidase
MTLEDKAAAVFMVRPGHAGTLPVGGVIFMSQDVTSAEQVKRDIAALRAASPIPLFVGTDEEGGRVSRLGKLPGFPKAKAAASYGYDTEAVYADYRAVGQAMAELGFDLNFAPCADVLTNPQNTVIGDRSFGSDPALAADCVRQAARGLTDAGLLPVAKHFPGQGGTGGDSHTGAVTGEVDDGLLAPFRAALDLGGVPAAVMVGHITVNDAPATLDAELVSGLLRDELDFDGPVFTDALDMGAITDSHSPAEAAVLALQAGCDILLLPEDLAAAHRGVTDALISGELDESILDAALLRQFRLKGRA